MYNMGRYRISSARSSKDEGHLALDMWYFSILIWNIEKALLFSMMWHFFKVGLCENYTEKFMHSSLVFPWMKTDCISIVVSKLWLASYWHVYSHWIALFSLTLRLPNECLILTHKMEKMIFINASLVFLWWKQVL